MQRTQDTFELSPYGTIKVVHPLIISEGYMTTKKIKLEDIYFPTNEKDAPNNLTRPELDREKVSGFQVSLPTKPNWARPLMVVKEIKGGLTIKGKTYRYMLVDGFHRYTALNKQLVESWIFDVYQIPNINDEVDFQGLANDHDEFVRMKPAGWTNLLKFKVSLGTLTTEQDMKDYMNKFVNVTSYTKTKAVKDAVKDLKMWRDFVTYSYDEVNDFIDNLEDNYPDDIIEKGLDIYKLGGEIDTRRKSDVSGRYECGWSVLYGYEDEYLFNAMKKYHETGNPSYFIKHFNKSPSLKSDIVKERAKMDKNFNELEDALVSTFKYYEKHGTFPWRDECWMPQDNTRGESMFITEGMRKTHKKV